MIRDGVIATNRHVLEEIAEPDHEAADGSGWRLNRDVTIDFSGEFDRLSDPEKRFGIGRVLFAGADPIKGTLDPRKLDVAILELQERSDAAFPKPLRLAADTAVPAVDTPVYILGFPGRCDPRHESASVCSRIYANTYGFKRWAPGQVALAAGEHPLDLETKWVFTHDASTLAGNSGSCVVDLESDGATVVGIHFGGRRRLENFAHAISRIMDRL
jgi:hypothetical protein